MAITVETISVADIHENPKNPRGEDGFGDLAVLASSFSANAANPGQPFQPIQVVRDGSSYLLLDGARRLRAMRRLGTLECQALVGDGLDDQAVMLQMLATDDKERLNANAVSRGFQASLLLGVDPGVLMKANQASRGRNLDNIRRVVDDRGIQQEMPLDKLDLIGEAMELGLAGRVIDAMSRTAYYAAREILASAKHDIEVDAMVVQADRWLNGLGGIAVVPIGNSFEVPKGYVRLERGITKRKDLRAAVSGHDPSDLLVIVAPGWPSGTEVSLLVKREASREDDGLEEARQAEELETHDFGASGRRVAWICERINDWQEQMPNTIHALLGDGSSLEHYPVDLQNAIWHLEQHHSIQIRLEVSPVVLALCYYHDLFLFGVGNAKPLLGLTPMRDWEVEGVRHYIIMLDAMRQDGYIPDDGETRLLALSREALAAYTSENDGLQGTSEV